MSPPSAPHDALFRRLFSDHAIARGALTSVLPADVVAMIDFATLELQPASHVDEVLHAFHSDVVFSAKIAGRDARLLLLLEHQSSPDAMMPFRLLGPAEWRAPLDMLEVLDLTEEERTALARYAPRMHFELDDLGRLSDAELRARAMPPEAALALAALRDVRTAAGTETGLRALGAVVRYVLEVHGGLDVEELAKIAGTLLPGAGATIMATARELIEQGRAQGKAEGILAGRRTTLKHLLTLKFRAAATDDVLARVDAADGATLDTWERRILTAHTVDDVLA